ncbi:hypothetical protein GCM10007047_31590 [Cerasicoccus arenae]|uniref:AAA+ ATPase domain-containing protein n=1 Tax=Cerasicoccus arenae TaxID=424488 RepID=A0A8J3DMK5_9BACT|nr:hypothetical protein GCM10007047_31590 [Cerasicoccus arenae]
MPDEITKDIHEKLCDNQRPDGTKLTARNRDNRRPGFDFNFHPPKSVTALYELAGDRRIEEAFVRAVQRTMSEVERNIECRIRKGGVHENRKTGNAAYSLFLHRTTRPVMGSDDPELAPLSHKPDPHLHAHAFVYNATYDAVEKQWKAIQLYNMKFGGEAPYYEGYFHNELAREMLNLGYRIESTRDSWEIADVPPSIREKFSRRTRELEALAQERGITSAREKAALNAKTRQNKAENLTMDELQTDWKRVLSPAEEQALAHTYQRSLRTPPPPDDPMALERACSHALWHCLERRSDPLEKRVIGEALKSAPGHLRVDKIRERLQEKGAIVAQIGGQERLTTVEAFRQEEAMKSFARRGRGREEPLNPQQREWRCDLFRDPSADTAQQKQAIEHILKSRDRVIAVRGAAGTGKTSMMEEAVRGIEEGGRRAFVFAPTADAARSVLRGAGFTEADTVQQLLKNPQWKDRVKGQAIWIDEAGLLSVPDMQKIFELAQKQDCRVILTGDDKQHNSVIRGDAFRILQNSKCVRPVELTRNQRQKSDPRYQLAVDLLSRGNEKDAARGFDRLVKMGAIHQAPRDEIAYETAASYVKKVARSNGLREKTSAMVCPTHEGNRELTGIIRSMLRDKGVLGTQEHDVVTLRQIPLTEADKRQARNYEAGQVIEFHRAIPGCSAGSRVVVDAVDPQTGKVWVNNHERQIDLSYSERFSVYARETLQVAQGERLRITKGAPLKNPKTGESKQMENGMECRVKGFDRRGSLILDNGWAMPTDFGHISHGYCRTSQASQGQTRDGARAFMPSDTLCATNREAFYVTVSRGKEDVEIFTDNIEELRESILRSAARRESSEVVRAKSPLLYRKMQAGFLRDQFSEMAQSFCQSARRKAAHQLEIGREHLGHALERNLPITKGFVFERTRERIR